MSTTLAAKPKLPFTVPSGAYIEAGPRDYQLYASIPRSDALIAVLEIDEDCPGQVYTYFMRGGIADSRMTVAELFAGATALAELLAVAKIMWPRKTTAEVDR